MLPAHNITLHALHASADEQQACCSSTAQAGAAPPAGVQETTECTDQHQPASTSPAPRGRKLLKDGTRFKRSGLCDGAKRGHPRTVHFKYAVVQHYRSMQEQKKLKLISDPCNATVAFFGGITHGQVSAWSKIEEKLRSALLGANQPHHRGRRTGASDIISMRSAAARKFSLHPGSGRKYAAAEAEVHSIYKEKRAKGIRVSSNFLRIEMKRQVARIFGDEVLQTFKASAMWLAQFACHYNMSLRVGTNKKNLSVAERVTKCKRWHARFRRRLSRGSPDSLHAKWGRWLPENRISLDQVTAPSITHQTHCILELTSSCTVSGSVQSPRG